MESVPVLPMDARRRERPVAAGPRWVFGVMWAGVALVLAACGPGQRAEVETGQASRLASLQGTPGQPTAAVASSDLAVGPNQRFVLALIGPDNALITDAAVEIAFFKVTGPGQAQLRSRATAEFREPPGIAGKGVYVARTDFDEAGDWGVAALVTRPAGEPTELRVAFQVREKSATPAIGDPVPPSQTLTGTTPQEVERFSSARPVDLALYRVSVAEALGEGKPFAVLFATPGFCTSRLCGPSLEVLKELRNRYGGQANFIHVEVYKDGRPPDMVPFVTEWGLPSEPWLFIVGVDGRLVDKLEGNISADEAAPALERALGV